MSTLRNLKLCMCNVDKCKILAVGPCHVEVRLCLTDILNSNRKKIINDPVNAQMKI